MNRRVTEAERADGVIASADPFPHLVAHECHTCHGTGGINSGGDYEHHGNVSAHGERCPTCDGEGFIYEPADPNPAITDGVAERRGGIKILPAATVIPNVEVKP